MVPADDEKTSIVASDTFKGRLKAADDAPPALVVLMGPGGYVGKQFALLEKEMYLGRSVESHIYVDDKSVSRSHARITVNGSECTIEDLGSSNKTIINGQTLGPAQPTRLRNNDQIKTGNIIFKFLEKGSLETITHQELTEKAMKDALTGAFTKGALLEKGPEAMKRSDFLKEELSVVVFDIDFFKKINDTYGHPCGDYVLKHLAHVVGTKLVRANDYFARYGGEEFVILLSGAAMTRAMDVAERVRSTVQATEFEFEGHKIPVTVSLGVASRIPTETEWDDLFQRADDALYVSKRNGRNRVTAA